MNTTRSTAPPPFARRWPLWRGVITFSLVGMLLFLGATPYLSVFGPQGGRLYHLFTALLLFAWGIWQFAVLRRWWLEQEQANLRQKDTERLLGETYQRLAAVFSIRMQFSEAEDEKEIVDLLLRHTVELTGAAGASFVPLDDHRQPLTAVTFGASPESLPNHWLEYLASPDIRSRCSACEQHNHLASTCPLLQGPFANVAGVYCIPLRSGKHEYGVLNLYIPEPSHLDMETQAFLNSLVGETSHALETVWLRKRELATLQQIQTVQQKSDLYSLLGCLVSSVHQTIEPDFTLLALHENGRGTSADEAASTQSRISIREELTCGELPSQAEAYLQALVQTVLASGQPLSASNPPEGAAMGIKTFLAAPLRIEADIAGAVIVGYRRMQSTSHRQISLMQTAAGQMALVLHSANQLAEMEYNVVMEERTRLAREIHDGLAQTLGFLKLQAAQMLTYLEREDFERLQQALKLQYQTLSETYQEARYAIDGLRISPCGIRLNEWLQQVLDEFKENFDPQALEVHVDCQDVQWQLPPEVQAQLIRIVQEALINVRKHAQAKNVWVSCKETGGSLVVEIQDDGRGFSREDVPNPSRHGLRGMRERAELIRASFLVTSDAHQGTTVRVSLPIRTVEVVL